jgi:hypothetical protein
MINYGDDHLAAISCCQLSANWVESKTLLTIIIKNEV